MKSRPKPLLIIVNADDLGASQAVNQAIFRELDAGRITSTSLMANGPAFDDAVRGIRAYPQASVGVHLNLTEFEPLSATPSLQSLLDKDGRLHPGLRYRPFTLRQLRAVYHEFSAQIRRVLQAGVTVSHLDSHWHIHTRPDFLPIVKVLQRRFAIERVRTRLNLYPPSHPPILRNRIAIPLCNAALRFGPHSRTTDGMGRLAVFVEWLSLGYLPRFRTIELMVHPGLEEREYRDEVELLSSPWLDRLPCPFLLTSF
jgi:chitin disaccharide deacetylase